MLKTRDLVVTWNLLMELCLYSNREQNVGIPIYNYNFFKRLKTQLIPSLSRTSIIVVDKAPYHSVQINKAPIFTKESRYYVLACVGKYLVSPWTVKMWIAELLKLNKLEPEYIWGRQLCSRFRSFSVNITSTSLSP